MRAAKRQIEKEKGEKIQAIESAKEERVAAIREKEQKLLSWENQAKQEEEKYVDRFNKQKEAILKQKQMEQQRELARGVGREEAARLMQKHRDDLGRLEQALASE